MMIENQVVKIKFNFSHNKQYFLDKGYVPIDNYIFVPIEDLPANSQYKIKVKCDYCNKEYEKPYSHLYGKEKHCCKKCIYLKAKETNLKKYGVENPGQRIDIREKVEKTCLERYGVNNAYQIESVRQTTLENHGVLFPFQSEKIREKQKQTMLQKYGNVCPYGSKEIKNKVKITNLKKYGVEYASQNEIIKNKIIKKIYKSMYENGTGPCSKQQKHLCKLLGGELNFTIEKYMLDIAFMVEMIYIEYNGGGHYIWPNINKMSEKDFNLKETIRYNYMKNAGWKLIRIICKNDKLYNDDKIIYLIDECKQYLLNSNHSWIEINIDENKINCKQFTKNII